MPLVDPITMSSSSPSGKAVTSPSSQTQKPAEAEAPTQPIAILSTSSAQTARHVHPVLVASLFLMRFRALVTDPVSTMWSSLAVLTSIQVAYAMMCLPPAGSQTLKPAKKHRPGEKKKADHGGPNIVVTTTVALSLSLIATGILHIFFVLFGAPLLTHLPHTFLCALHLSVLGLFPLFYTRGVSNREWLEILGARAPFDEAFGGIVGALVGAWLGAVPIPLDWDREWQKWPVTILCGTYGGYLVGKLVCGTLAYGRRFG